MQALCKATMVSATATLATGRSFDPAIYVQVRHVATNAVVLTEAPYTEQQLIDGITVPDVTPGESYAIHALKKDDAGAGLNSSQYTFSVPVAAPPPPPPNTQTYNRPAWTVTFS